MAEITQGHGVNASGNETSTYYAYVGFNAATFWDGSGTCDTINVYVVTNAGDLQLWSGVLSDNGDGTHDFVFDSYDPVVDIDISSMGTGWLTLTAPTHFTAFEVTEGHTFLVYSQNSGTRCTLSRSNNATYNGYSYLDSGPPYSSTLTLTDSGSALYLNLNCTGETAGGGSSAPIHIILAHGLYIGA